MSEPVSEPRSGFLEESPGHKSATRLAALAMTAAIVGLVVALAAYVLVARPPEAAVIGAVAAPIAPLAAGVWAALKERE